MTTETRRDRESPTKENGPIQVDGHVTGPPLGRAEEERDRVSLDSNGEGSKKRDGVVTVIRNASDSSTPPMPVTPLPAAAAAAAATTQSDGTASTEASTGTRPTTGARTVSFSAEHALKEPSQLENGLVLTHSASTSSYKSRTALLVDDQTRRLAALGHETELARNFDFWASMGIGISNIGALQGTFLSILTAYSFGGPSMYSIAWPITGVLFCSLAAILGEMASTYPVAGAMFTWTFRLARSSKRLNGSARYLSWIVASFLLCYHVLVQIVITWQVANMITGTVTLHHINFHPTVAETLAVCWAVLIFCGLVVSAPVSRSPWLWRICGFGIIAGFIIMNVVLLAKAPEIRPASFVFTTFRNQSGWSSKGIVYLLGWSLTSVAVGMEASAHMAEDTIKPSRTVPMAMFWATFTSYALGWLSICVLLATTQPRGLDSRLNPQIALFANTLSRPLATFVCVVIILCQLAQNVAQLLATSRFIWALARERAIPFSLTFFRLAKSTRQPLNAIWAVVVVAVPSLALLVISTRIISTILLEGAAWSIMAAMWIPVAIYISCPPGALTGDGRAEWTLRSFSKPLACIVSGFALLFLIILCVPTGYPVTPLNASYASVVAVGIWILASITWILYGNARYAGPIKATTKWTIGAEIELPSSSTGKNGTTRNDAQPNGLEAGLKGDQPSDGYPRVGETTSGMHGKTARVFWSSTDGGETSFDLYSARTDDTAAAADPAGSRWSRRSRGHPHQQPQQLDTTLSNATSFDPETSQYTEDYTDNEEEGDDDEGEDEDGERVQDVPAQNHDRTGTVVRPGDARQFRERVTRLGSTQNVVTP